MRACSSYVLKHFGSPDRIISSPVLRALQSARIIAENTGAKLEISDGVAPDAEPSCFVLPEEGVTAVVTHKPFIRSMVAMLCTDFKCEVQSGTLCTLRSSGSEWKCISCVDCSSMQIQRHRSE